MLALFALAPVLARFLVELAGGSVDTPANAHAAASVPLIVHAASGTLFTTLGAFQFPTAVRRRGRGTGWHPRVGRLLVPLGLVAGLSALWLTVSYSHPDGGEPLLYVLRLIFGVAMVAAVVAGFIAIRRRDVLRHRAWMIRAYAIGLGASTQILTLGVGGAMFGTGELSTALLTGAGWVVNLVVAERVIRHREPRARERRRRARTYAGDGIG
ncbi:MAG: DUF2306 domain-containing protein [Actinomycetota bacterium]|nr:DUF2306 domain-containing protein [Actinomycetota bacterium]